MNVLNQWETDLQKTREAEEKLEVLNNWLAMFDRLMF